MAINSGTQDMERNAVLEQAAQDNFLELESFGDSDDAFDSALEDSIIECLGSVLAVCFNGVRKEDVSSEDVEKMMLEGNLIYNKLQSMCQAKRDLFFEIYAIAKDIKAKGQGQSLSEKISYEDALKQAEQHTNKERLCEGIEFIHNFRGLVRQRLLLVKPMLVNPQETKQVFDSISDFICYECVFDPAYN